MELETKNSNAIDCPVDTLVMLACPFCGEVPQPNDQDVDAVIGTCCEFDCNCGMAGFSVQICDLMTREERARADFIDYMYPLKYRQRALEHCIKLWNTRAI